MADAKSGPDEQSSAERLAALHAYGILDTPAEAGFDDIVVLACQICETPVALVSLVAGDRQWFKAKIGFDACQTPLDQSVCRHALAQPGLLIIPDLTVDPRTRANTLVTGEPHIRFYAGARLETSDGQPLGSLCVIDMKPRPEGLTLAQASGLGALARQVMAQMELRRTAVARDVALREVRESQLRQRRIFESAVDYAIIAMDRAGTITDWNTGAERILGWSALEMQGATAHRFFTPEDVARDRVAVEMRSVLRDGRGDDERWHLRKDGSRFWASGEMMFLRGEDGEELGFLKVLRDETVRRASAESLREAQGLNTLILSSSRDCIVVLDLQGHTQFVSAGGIEAMEITDVGVGLGLSWLRVWQGVELDAARSAIAAAREGGIGRFQGFCATHKGTPKWWDLVISPLVGPDGTPEQLVSVGRDITQQKQAEIALRALNDDLERRVGERTRERDRVWRNSQDLLAVIDVDGVFRSVSPAAARILGWASEEMVEKTVFDFIHPDDRSPSQDALWQASRDDLPTFVNRYRHKDGGHRWMSWVAAPEDDLIYASGRDVTAERAQAEALYRTEEQLRQSQKMEAVGQLTGGVAHDFNNLLTVIRSSVDLLKRPDLSAERRDRYVQAISDTTTRAAKLTGQLLAFARRQALQPEVFDIGQSVAAIGDMVVTLTGSRVRIQTRVPDRPCFVNADPSHFDTAMINLAVNARDAMNGEGTLGITVSAASEIPAMRAHPATLGDYVAVSVTDTGSGIAPTNLDKIFEPFFTTKDVGQGTGLGLSQVFGFVKQSGGEIDVQSEVGRGTTFTLYLPRVEAPDGATVTHKRVEQALVDGHGTCVLIVEDNADVGAFATQALGEVGYGSVLAINARAALAELEADADRFDVVFSDVVMPGMSGIEFAQEVRRRHADLPVVLTSGYSHVLAQNGTDGFELLQKPYSVEQLSRVLQQAAQWRRLTRTLVD